MVLTIFIFLSPKHMENTQMQWLCHSKLQRNTTVRGVTGIFFFLGGAKSPFLTFSRHDFSLFLIEIFILVDPEKFQWFRKSEKQKKKKKRGPQLLSVLSVLSALTFLIFLLSFIIFSNFPHFPPSFFHFFSLSLASFFPISSHKKFPIGKSPAPACYATDHSMLATVQNIVCEHC